MNIFILNDNFLFVAPFLCSIRVAVAFIGFLGMVAHYSQKISIGMALVCMVNHSSIATVKNVTDVSFTQIDTDCPRLNNSVNIVRNKK